MTKQLGAYQLYTWVPSCVTYRVAHECHCYNVQYRHSEYIWGIGKTSCRVVLTV